MCDLRIAFRHLLDKQLVNTNINTANVFKNDWYSYEYERKKREEDTEKKKSCSNALSVIMNPISNTIQPLPPVLLKSTDEITPFMLQEKQCKPKNKNNNTYYSNNNYKRTKNDQVSIFYHVLRDWTMRDLLIAILILQLFMFITVVIK